MTHYKFVFPPRNDKIDFVRVFEGGHVDLALVATGVPEPLTIAPNNPAIARAAAVPATGAAPKVNVKVAGLSAGGSQAHVMLEARNSKKEVVAFTQIIVFNHKVMVVSPAGVRFVANEEDFVEHLYNDPAGHCTIGYGHLVHHGNCDGSEPAQFKTTMTKADGEILLRTDLGTAQHQVRSKVKVPLYQEEFDAIVSFTFNAGGGNFASSTLLKRLNSQDFDAVPSELAKWIYSKGIRLPGLVVRRQHEGALFRDGVY